jgi:hypothetical protein
MAKKILKAIPREEMVLPRILIEVADCELAIHQ